MSLMRTYRGWPNPYLSACGLVKKCNCSHNNTYPFSSENTWANQVEPPRGLHDSTMVLCKSYFGYRRCPITSNAMFPMYRAGFKTGRKYDVVKRNEALFEFPVCRGSKTTSFVSGLTLLTSIIGASFARLRQTSDPTELTMFAAIVSSRERRSNARSKRSTCIA